MTDKEFEEELKSIGDPPTGAYELGIYTEAKLDIVVRYLQGRLIGQVTSPDLNESHVERAST